MVDLKPVDVATGWYLHVNYAMLATNEKRKAMLNPAEFMSEIESLSIYAGNAIMQVRDKGVERTDKADGSPVTEADLAADKIIIEGLAAMAPDIPAITEETYSVASDYEPQEYWCVDPLDGTKGFINGGKDFTVNIALIADRAPQLGVIYAPALGTLWAGYGQSAWIRRIDTPSSNADLADFSEAESIQVVKANLENPAVVATKAHRGPALEAWIEKLNVRDSIAVGSSLKFCTIAEGKADLYPRIGPTMEWDTAAGQAIVEAAGGSVLASGGDRFSYGKPGRLNGYFAVMGAIEDTPPQSWIPPHEGGDG